MYTPVRRLNLPRPHLRLRPSSSCRAHLGVLGRHMPLRALCTVLALRAVGRVRPPSRPRLSLDIRTPSRCRSRTLQAIYARPISLGYMPRRPCSWRHNVMQ
ncbi:hypothetical protein GY45DRAFT_383561 [Cubamyces sp. BRFM 1775]|nr:hypothetical protein GY45DRAFT_383561 [Cubamyces sp. BRFM 1775]